MASTYIKATTIRLAAIGLNAISALLLLPFILKTLGEYEFGVWGMATAISGYLLLLDFGIAQACTRYIAISLEDKTAWVRTLTNAMWVALIVSIALLLMAISLQVWIDMSAAPTHIIEDVVTILLIEVAFSLPLRLYQSIMRADVDYTALGWHEITRILLRVIGIPLLLWLDMGLIGIVIYSSIVNSMFFALALLHIKHKYGRYFINLKMINKNISMELMNFGKYALVSQVAEFFKYRVDSLLVGLLVGIPAVAGYAIMVVLIDMLAQIQMRLQSYWDTVIIRQIGEGNPLAATHTMLKSLQLGLAFTLLAITNAYWFADIFLGVWVGNQYLPLQPLLVIFITVLAGSALQLATTPYFNALNYAKLNAGLGLAEVLLKLIVVAPLVMLFQAKGVVYATVLATLLVSLGVRLWYLAPITGFGYGQLTRKILKPLLPLFAGLAVLVLFYQICLLLLSSTWAKGLVMGLEIAVLGLGWLYRHPLLTRAPNSRRPSLT